jgi:large subunit ribosomal protein L25
MSSVTLNAATDRVLGSRSTRRLRTSGQIPGVVYGEGVNPMSVAVNAKEFRAAVSGEQGLNTVLTLNADGATFTVMARQIQRHPVRGTVAHVDFQVVDLNKSVTVTVPLHVVGDAVEVRHADYEIEQSLFTLSVSARPDLLPTHIDVDVSHLRAGGSIRVAEVPLADGVVAAQDLETAVVITYPGRAAKTAAPATA